MERLANIDVDAFAKVKEVRLCEQGLTIGFAEVDPAQLTLRLESGERILQTAKRSCTVLVPVVFLLRGGARRTESGARSQTNPDPVLIATLRRAHRILTRECGLPALDAAFERQVVRLAFLSPAIKRDNLAGRQPAELTAEKLKCIAIPLDWSDQPAALGFADALHLIR